MIEPQKYIGKPIEVEALQVSQYGDFARARDWINGGKPGKSLLGGAALQIPTA